MSINEYFCKSLFASIIVGPALVMTVPLVYWLQYENMMLFPCVFYYVAISGGISSLLYFTCFILPGNCTKANKGNFKNKPEEHLPTLSPSSPDAFSTAHQKESKMYKHFFYAYAEKYLKGKMPDKDAQTILNDIYQVVDNRAEDLIKNEKETLLPFEVNPVSNFSGLNSEDICHIGFVTKFFLGKPNEYGAIFIKTIFPQQLRNVELSTLTTKLASNESSSSHIPIPDICKYNDGSVRKKFCDCMSEQLIEKL